MLKIILSSLLALLSLNSVGRTDAYVRGDLRFDEVAALSESEWSPLEGRLYQGYRNGIYWIRIPNERNHDVLRIHESHIRSAFLYCTGVGKIAPVRNTRKISFQTDRLFACDTFYLRVDFNKEAILTIDLLSTQDFYHDQAISNTGLGIYYGLVIVVVLINLFSYFNFRRVTYLHYIVMLSSISLGLAASDGTLRLLTDSPFLHTYAEPFFNLCVSLILPVLANSYMPLKSYIPRINILGGAFGVISVGLFVGYVVSGNFLVFCFTQLAELILVTVYWFGGFIIFRKCIEARIFTIAYFIICFSCYDFYIAQSFGFSLIGLSLNEFRIGAIVEMFVFTFAIAHQSKLLVRQNEEMRFQLRQYALSSSYKSLSPIELDSELAVMYNLTPKEISVLKCIAEGKINKEIAELLHISVNTVKFHIKNIYQKMETSSKQETRKKYLSLLR